MPLVFLPHNLDASVDKLPDVGPTNAKRLSKLGIESIRDLLLTLPFGWQTYGDPADVAGLRDGQQATVVGVITQISAKQSLRRRMRLTEATIRDDRGASLRLVWFNQQFVARQLSKGDRIAVAGVAKTGRYADGLQMQNPYYEKLNAEEDAQPTKVGGMMPKYHLVDGLTSRKVARWVASALPLADQLEDLVPEDIRERHRLLGIAEAVRRGHKPETDADFREATRRMDFAELFELQTAFALMRSRMAAEPAPPIPFRQAIGDAFKVGLGFELTNAQRRACRQAFNDMQGPSPMNRLLNGDVGSGKTAVAAACAAMVHAAGMQTAVMAPTDILARQHYGKFRAYLESTFPDLRVELMVGSQSAAERHHSQLGAASGHCALLVGTHALIEDGVQFANLGLVVVDEQHRFGIHQRELLRGKGHVSPHFLAMTATPIPRTLALALYGEMVMSVIDELPPGRRPVATEVIDRDDRRQAYDLVRREVLAGHQAFVICPLIDQSEAIAVRSATAEAERLQREIFPEFRLDLIHGRLKDKEQVMQRFAAGETQILVATAVVEVGVDVPNATVMMIEGADRFGLAQLHQFRGRVGRGQSKSYCLLLTDDDSKSVLDRLNLLTQINNGFKLAEEDLRLRGIGELIGQRQHGRRTDLAMRVLLKPELLDEAHTAAQHFLESDPGLTGNPPLKSRVDALLEQVAIS